MDQRSRKRGHNWKQHGDIRDGLGYVNDKIRGGDLSDLYPNLLSIISNDSAGTDVHQQAIQLFRQYIGDFKYHSEDNRWVISYVTQDGKRFIIEDLDKDLLDGGQRYPQEECQRVLGEMGRDIQGLHEFTDLTVALDREREKKLGIFKFEDIYNLYTAHFMPGNYTQMLKSRVLYRPQGQKDVFYPRGSCSQAREIDLSSLEECLRDIQPLDYLDDEAEILFGSQAINSMRNAFSAVDRDPVRLWCFEEKPEHDREFSVVLDFDNQEELVICFGVDIDEGMNASGVARGWSRICERRIESK